MEPAARLSLQALRPADRFSLVAYDDEVATVVEATKATAEARRNAIAKLGRIDARGSTDLHGGEGADYAQSMNAKDQKVRYVPSYNITMNRMPDAKAKR